MSSTVLLTPITTDDLKQLSLPQNLVHPFRMSQQTTNPAQETSSMTSLGSLVLFFFLIYVSFIITNYNHRRQLVNVAPFPEEPTDHDYYDDIEQPPLHTITFTKTGRNHMSSWRPGLMEARDEPQVGFSFLLLNNYS